MDVDWMSQWGNYIVSHRTPANWKEYGEEAGRFLAQNEWDEFLFYRIASALSLTPEAVAEKAEKLAHEMVDAFRLHGIEMWRDYDDQNHGTPAERKIWLAAFTSAYTETMERQVDSIVPPKLVKNLDLFCNLLGWMRFDMDRGDGRAADYGLRLSGKKKEPEKPEKPKYRPSRKELHDHAVQYAKRLIEKEWNQFMARKSDGAVFRTSMLKYGIGFSRQDEEWYVPDLDRDYFTEVMTETFQDELGKRALELAPASAWKNSYLICTLYDQLLAQNPPRKKADEQRPGFWIKRNRESYEEKREKEDWKASERLKMRKQLEKEVARKEKQESKSKPKMSGPAAPKPQALIVVHLSSLDSYTAHAGSEEGKLLGERLTQAIRGHEGPVIIVDQGWETGYRESRPREQLLLEIQSRRDVVWIHFDEAVESWDDFFPQLQKAIDELGVRSAIVGGVWYDPSLHTGCATFVYTTLRQVIPTVVDEDLVGCE